MSKRLDLVNKEFGRLKVIEFSHMDKHSKSYWVCECECGTRKTVNGNSLMCKHTKSCGCLQKEEAKDRFTTHGLRNTRIYDIWCGMKKRCNNLKCQDYKDYGDRNIIVCKEWNDNFQTFYDWSMSNGYLENLTIDRIDVDGNYEPSNCKWSTNKEQSKNKRTTSKYGVGVSKKSGRYNVKIRINGKSIYLGTYDTPEQAQEAYRLEEHKNK